MSQFQAAARSALAGIAGRGPRPCWSAGPACTCGPWSTASSCPGAGPRWRPAWRPRRTEPGGLAALYRRLRAARPGGGVPHQAHQPAPGRPGPGGDGRVGPALLLVRPGPRAYPPTPLHPGRAALRPVLPSTGGSRSASPAWMDAGLLDEVRALAGPARGAVPDRPPGPRLPRAAGPRGGRRAPRGVRGRGGPAHPGFARRQWAWFRRDPRIRVAGPRRGPRRRCCRTPWQRSARRRELEDWPVTAGDRAPDPGADKHQGAGNDFLVVLAPRPGVRPAPTADRAGPVRPAPRRGGRRGDPWSRHRADGADLVDGAAQRRRGRGRDERQRHAVPGPGGRGRPGWWRRPASPWPRAAGLRTVDLHARARRPAAAWATVDMGPATLGPERRGRRPAGPARSTSATPTWCVWGADPAAGRRGHGRAPPVSGGHPAASTSSSWRPGPDRTSWCCGCGSAGSARPWPVAPGALPPRPPPGLGRWSADR